MKKLMSILLAALLVAACLPALAEARTGTALFPTDENGYPDLGGVTLSIWETWDTSMVDFCKDYNDLKIVQDLAQKFNVNFDFRMAPAGQESENFTLMIASSDLPDIIFELFDRISRIFGAETPFGNLKAINKIEQIFSFFIWIVNTCKALLLLLLAFLACRIKTVRIPVIDKLIDKFAQRAQ